MIENKDNKNIHFLWPTVFLEENIGVKKEYLSYVKKLNYHRLSTDNGWCTKDYDLLDHKIFKELKNKIILNAKYYLQNIFLQKDYKLKIISSWCMKHLKNDFAQRHLHQNSYLSGVYYLQTTENSGKITFVRNIRDYPINTTIRPDVKTYNEINGSTFWVKVNSGQLIIFPSNIEHETEKSKSSTERYCIAFNIMLSGQISTEDSKWIL